jgi:hypothetical protein
MVVAPIHNSTTSFNINHLSFMEKAKPLARNIYYDLYVSSDTSQYDRGFLLAARVYYQRLNSLVYGIPTDVLMDRQQQKLHVMEQNCLDV